MRIRKEGMEKKQKKQLLGGGRQYDNHGNV